MGVPNVNLPDDPIQSQPDYAAALAAFQALPPVRILFDNGAGSAPGAPVPGFEQSFARFPLPGTRARSWYLRAGGALADTAPANGAAATSSPGTRRPGRRPSFSGDTGSGTNGLWTATPPYHWQQGRAGTRSPT